jgi:hypothetical protein
MVVEIAGALAILGVAAAIWFFVAATRARSETRRERQRRVVAEQQSAGLEQQVRSLARYQVIVDAEAHAASVVSTAQAQVSRTVVDAEQRAASAISIAQQHAEALIENANETRRRAMADAETTSLNSAAQSQAAKAQAEAAMSGAQAEAARIVEAAHKRAEAIAGDAYAAMEKANLLESTAAAMKNIIEGYGDRYVVPTHSALDDLAEHFGFAEAGQRLKLSRERVREMIKKGTAATCDYAEMNRRATAIEFVLDAFNGKVDTILADVRDDNYGTLTQKIKDAFSVVNHNGAAFRNARITPEYLEARLDELRWAVAASELKEKEKEEQRALRERIREEERAQREYERAMKEAEKEEEMLRKAMEKVRKEVDKATDEQKTKYEHQLAELGDKLRAAEEKNQRALSMAQQTKAGHVYVISNVGSFGEHVYKIGLTRRLDPHERVHELGDASVPFDFDVHTMIRSADAPALERELHRRFMRNQVNKVNARKEFFRVTVHDIRTEVERMGCQATWTMTAECREYKESLAMQKTLDADPHAPAAKWMEAQLQEKDAAPETPKEAAVG